MATPRRVMVISSGRIDASLRGMRTSVESIQKMADQFTDIKIVSLDDDASRPSVEHALFRVVLKLSQRAPSEWAEYFNQAWRKHSYGLKWRRATVFGDTLEVICMPNELQTDHIPELKKVILDTNEEYKKHAADQERIGRAQEERVQRQKQELSELRGRLKFD
jgi:hypothetical protein